MTEPRPVDYLALGVGAVFVIAISLMLADLRPWWQTALVLAASTASGAGYFYSWARARRVEKASTSLHGRSLEARIPLANEKLIIECIRELSDRAAQHRLWLTMGERGAGHSSFTEAVEGLFTDSGLTPDLEKRSTELGAAVEDALLALDEALRKVDRRMKPADLIASERRNGSARLRLSFSGCLKRDSSRLPGRRASHARPCGDS